MPQCVNDPSSRYTGKEPSPKGRGYCAHATPLATRKKGTDGQTYAVAARIDGTKYWKKIALKKPKAAAAKPSPRHSIAKGLALVRTPPSQPLPKKIGALDLYTVQIPRPRWAQWESQMSSVGKARFAKLRQEVLPALCAAGLPATVVPLPKDGQTGGYWIDLAWDWAQQKLGVGISTKPTLIAILWLGVNPAEVSKTKPNITIQHMFLSKQQRTQVHEQMRAAFGPAFTWDGTSRSEMTLSLAR